MLPELIYGWLRFIKDTGNEGSSFISTLKWIWTYLILLCFTILSFTEVHFLQIESKTNHQQKDYESFYCNTHFIVVIWNGTHNIWCL